MSKQVLSILKFIAIFSAFIFIAIIYELKLNEQNYPKKLKLFNNAKVDSICQKEESSLKCFQKSLGEIFSKATPLMIYYIIDTNDILFERENRISGISEESIYLYVKNWNIILDHLSSFYLSTDRIHFFQVMLLPGIKLFIKSRLKNAQKNINSINIDLKSKSEIKNEIERFRNYKINIT